MAHTCWLVGWVGGWWKAGADRTQAGQQRQWIPMDGSRGRAQVQAAQILELVCKRAALHLHPARCHSLVARDLHRHQRRRLSAEVVGQAAGQGRRGVVSGRQGLQMSQRPPPAQQRRQQLAAHLSTSMPQSGPKSPANRPQCGCRAVGAGAGTLRRWNTAGPSSRAADAQRGQEDGKQLWVENLGRQAASAVQHALHSPRPHSAPTTRTITHPARGAAAATACPPCLP